MEGFDVDHKFRAVLDVAQAQSAEAQVACSEAMLLMEKLRWRAHSALCLCTRAHAYITSGEAWGVLWLTLACAVGVSATLRREAGGVTHVDVLV